MDRNELIEAIKVVKSWDSTFLPKTDGPYIARLVDEKIPDGLVELVDRFNVSRIQMPREVYDAIKG